MKEKKDAIVDDDVGCLGGRGRGRGWSGSVERDGRGLEELGWLGELVMELELVLLARSRVVRSCALGLALSRLALTDSAWCSA